MTLEDVLNTAGADLDATLRRFAGNRGLMERIIRRYPDDPTFAEFEKAMGELAYENVERAAHTLKGVTANLGFQRLSAQCSQVVEMVRSGRTEGMEAVFANIVKEHLAIVAAIKELA